MGKMYTKKLFAILFVCCMGNCAMATTYYSQSSSSVNTLANWNTNRLGGGTSPTNFTSNDIFVVQGTGNGGTSPHSMTTASAWTITGAAAKIQIENGGTLTATSIVAVTIFQVDNGGFYIHNAASAVAGGDSADVPGTPTKRVFGATSTVEFKKWANGGGTPITLPVITGSGWGNLIINVTTLFGSWNQSGTLKKIQGDLTVLKSGGGTFEFRFTGNTDYSGTIGGNVIVSTSSIMTFVSGSATITQIISGNVTISSSGILAFANSGGTVDYTIGGNLNVNTAGVFSLNSGGSGTVFISGTISGDVNLSDANSEINGSQLGGSGSWALTINGSLNISGGMFNFTGSSAASKTYTINLGGNYNQTGGSFGLVSSSYGTPNIACSVTFTGGVSNATFTQSSGTFSVGSSSNNRAISFFIANGKTLTLLSDFKLPPATYTTLDSFIVYNGGTLNNSTYNLTGYGNFILKSGATLKMGSPNGISVFPTTSGNIQNVGTGAVRTFNKGANYEYNGSAAQISGNGIPDSVRSLTINNSTGLTLSNASLTDTLILGLTAGRIKTDATHSLKLAKTTSVTSTVNIYGDTNEGNLSSFVSGPLTIETSASTTLRTFPIGKDTTSGVFYAPVKFTPNFSTVKTYTAEYFPSTFGDRTVELTLDHVSSIEYWNITSPSFNPDALIGLSWRPTSKLCYPTCDSLNAWTDLVVAHYFNSGGYKWRMDGGNPTFTMRTGSNLNYGYVTCTINTVGSGGDAPFTLGSKSNFNLLPLKLLYFSGYATEKTIELKWITKEEQQTATFELQKSADGIHFEALAIVAANNTTGVNNYSATDVNPVSGWNYYRLKVTDRNGKVGYSYIIKIQFGRNILLNIYPNPVINLLSVSHAKATANSQIKIFTVDGRLVTLQPVLPGSVHTQIKLSGLSGGMYLLKFINGIAIKTTQFYKQ